MSMWRTIYECHQVQNHISQQLSHLMNQQSMDPSTNYHRHAASQLITEVTSWYNSFHRLVKSQREYVRALCKWIQLTYCFVEDSQRGVSSSAVHTLCEEWHLSLDRLPDKVFMRFDHMFELVYIFWITWSPNIFVWSANTVKIQKKWDVLIENSHLFDLCTHSLFLLPQFVDMKSTYKTIDHLL